MIDLLIRLLVGIVPVLLFLGALVYLDSYKLVRLEWILLTIGVGGLVAGMCYIINTTVMGWLPLGVVAYSRYVSPGIEECAKALFMLWLIRAHRVGFLVDAAIYGFAIGTGFAVVENLYYLKLLPDLTLTGWIVRGCGTAVMHGGAGAIFGMTTKVLVERGFNMWTAGVPGIAMAFVIHSTFNHFFLTPVLSAVGMILGLPPLIFAVFNRSEGSLRDWLEAGFDADTRLLELINSGGFSSSKAGLYLHSLREKFRGEVVADLLCYLRLHLELSLRAKGLLMMRESGFKGEVDEETREKLRELEYLEGSIGRTGKLAMNPFLRMSGKELWQLYLIGK